MISINALGFAEHAHKGQFRWDGVTPYIEHPKQVVRLLESWGETNEMVLSAAYLHDTVEDTDTTFEDIKKTFGSNVMLFVQELTRPPKYDYVEHCKLMGQVAAQIKMADIICNLTGESKLSNNFINKRLKALAILKEKLIE